MQYSSRESFHSNRSEEEASSIRSDCQCRTTCLQSQRPALQWIRSKRTKNKINQRDTFIEGVMKPQRDSCHSNQSERASNIRSVCQCRTTCLHPSRPVDFGALPWIHLKGGKNKINQRAVFIEGVVSLQSIRRGGK